MFPICAWIHSHIVHRIVSLKITLLVIFLPKLLTSFGIYCLKMTLPMQNTGISDAYVQLGCNIYYMNQGACIFYSCSYFLYALLGPFYCYRNVAI
jgi:hypothetical protein